MLFGFSHLVTVVSLNKYGPEVWSRDKGDSGDSKRRAEQVTVDMAAVARGVSDGKICLDRLHSSQTANIFFPHVIHGSQSRIEKRLDKDKASTKQTKNES